MKRCPKCHLYNEDESVKCSQCNYEFKGKPKIKIIPIVNKQEESNDDEWPSDEWKDWNTM